MKPSFLYSCLASILLLVLGYTKAVAQSAIYVCEKTGRWGMAYDDGNAPRMPMEQTKKEAKKRCVDMRGEECILFFSSETKGWYSFFTGAKKGNIFLQSVHHCSLKKRQ